MGMIIVIGSPVAVDLNPENYELARLSAVYDLDVEGASEWLFGEHIPELAKLDEVLCIAARRSLDGRRVEISIYMTIEDLASYTESDLARQHGEEAKEHGLKVVTLWGHPMSLPPEVEKYGGDLYGEPEETGNGDEDPGQAPPD